MTRAERERRFLLGAVARREVFRDMAGTDRRWVGSDAEAIEHFAMTLGELEAEGLVVLPEFPDAKRGERYWELTGKALES